MPLGRISGVPKGGGMGMPFLKVRGNTCLSINCILVYTDFAGALVDSAVPFGAFEEGAASATGAASVL